LRLYLNVNGFGSSLLQILLKTPVKKNLYYEIKDRVDEEQFDGITVRKRPRKCRVYGSTSTHQKRNELIELLHQRVQHHRDKFATRELYDELCTMVVKPNGKTEHADDAHDDLIFSYLWALYVFYHGEDLATRFHLMKTEIYTDDHYDETSYSLEEEYFDEDQLDPAVFRGENEISKMVEEQFAIMSGNRSISLEDFYKAQEKEEADALEKIKQTAPGREAVAAAYHTPIDYLEKQQNNGYVNIVDDINDIFYDGEKRRPGEAEDPRYAGNLSDIFSRL